MALMLSVSDCFTSKVENRVCCSTPDDESKPAVAAVTVAPCSRLKVGCVFSSADPTLPVNVPPSSVD
jgi:hypothetical protein